MCSPLVAVLLPDGFVSHWCCYPLVAHSPVTLADNSISQPAVLEPSLAIRKAERGFRDPVLRALATIQANPAPMLS